MRRSARSSTRSKRRPCLRWTRGRPTGSTPRPPPRRGCGTPAASRGRAARTRLSRARTCAELPKTATALAAAEIDAAHVDALTRGRCKLGTPTMEQAEDTLLGLARTSSPDQLRLAVDRLVQVVDPDETATARAERQRALRHLNITPGFDGTWTLSGLLDPADGALVQAAFDACSGRQALPDGSPDPRTKAQRTADTLVQFAATALATGQAPTVGGVAPHLSLVLDLPTLRAELTAAAGAGVGGGGGSAAAAAAGLAASGLAALVGRSFGPAALARLTCACDLTPVIVSEWGEPLALGREIRLAPKSHVKAAWVRDGGCITPGCENRTVQVHHIKHWARDSGPTDLVNECLLCERCHHLVHGDGWTVEPDPARPGLFQIRSPRGGPPTPAVHALTATPAPPSPCPSPATRTSASR
ncbi:HNH endonuclease signature motif containing protein [Motilibacter peucedani]|uniref:HNH endonuclease signature motif containing protein n=1 Tax=Motilibacter peucedani TaxID=598650 RepID=UPI000EAF8F38|nr:HNH endonuclease signature motif containing protein [Motilibacter peucedani]